MDFSGMFETTVATMASSVPRMLMALGVLIVGWVVAVVLRALVRKSLGLVKLNERVRSGAGGKMDLEGGIARGIYFLVLVMAVIGFFNAVNLPMVSAPLQSLLDKVLAFLPNLMAGGALILVAWLIASILN